MGGSLSTTSSALAATTTVFPTTLPATVSCQPPATTIQTKVSIVTSTQYTNTATVTTTQYVSTSTFTSVGIAQQITLVPIYTSTVTYYDAPKVVITQLPFTSTTTVPTSPGFTLVLCLDTYQRPSPPFTISTSTFIYPSESTFYITTRVAATTTSTLYSFPVTNTVSIPVFDNSLTRLTRTSTSTRTNKVRTVYDACQTQNVIAAAPDRKGNIANVFTTNELGKEVQVYSVDQNDCCAICQGNSTCSGSAYFVNQLPPCSLFIRAAGLQCDPKRVGAYIGIAQQPEVNVYYSNSGCGQISRYGFDEA